MRVLLWAFGLAVLLFLLLPVLAILPLSFSAGGFLHYPLPGFSLRWYRDFLASDFWLPALGNSLVVGLGASALAVAFGTPAAFGLWRARLPFQGAILAVLLAPLAVPGIVVAVALLLAFGRWGLANSHAGLILAHAMLGVPFVVVSVLASLAQFDPLLLRAAASCGATPLHAFRRICLPRIAPGIAAGALFAFATSLDEVVVALFLGGPGQRTLPRQMFAGLGDQISLTVLAAACVMVALSVLLLALGTRLRRR
ncbi:ABC transporter permease [Falsiroseomonas selenitidurans]|uniref:ABC transporter permease n=1 Tax=Falsiroseomonas selenitidurans TaxID=2716335 RepID=A0ABX1EB31_9PROT|nr:ABC transporter permease [Falsiroseomonas selenitidurans]NKC32963.1 ABC transporter permease [Falsiroseomonas selenitidurans]